MLHPEKSPAQIDAAAALETYRINLLGPLLLLKHFSPLLPRSVRRSTSSHRSNERPDHDENSLSEHVHGLPRHATYILMSARVGSISDNKTQGGWYSYRSSKAGVNALAKTLDLYLRRGDVCADRAMATAMHPGTVKTGLSRAFWAGVEKGKLFEPDQAAGYLLDVVQKGGLDMRGRCWDWKGEEILP
ncbi:MAG: hypothetical protein M1838_002032 [Thelocarpon superellum]|nr:MAG: hypothetical protein M1838_002032 [Thelocarpon superellum]